ncbi:phosphatase PAP2 family protein [Stenotrophomonas sp. TWI809]|uniref:phosphatase PAP2 family protein n=1 Tax=Stenotrophomonas sp. TWI809 TaxID=3136796 RepID=UPI003208129C
MQSLWLFLSQLGDSRLLLPLSLVLILFGTQGDSALRVRWTIGLAIAGGLSLVSKLAFLGWGIGWAHLDFTGFSGHATMTAAIYPVALYLTLRGRVRLPLAGAVAGALLSAAISYSRLPLNAHSVSEVVSGWLLGMAVSSIALRGRSNGFVTPFPTIAGAILVGTMTIMMLSTVRTHDLVLRLATGLSGRTEVFTRPVNCTQSAPRTKPHCGHRR